MDPLDMYGSLKISVRVVHDFRKDDNEERNPRNIAVRQQTIARRSCTLEEAHAEFSKFKEANPHLEPVLKGEWECKHYIR